jgi:hypothetical protein
LAVNHHDLEDVGIAHRRHTLAVHAVWAHSHSAVAASQFNEPTDAPQMGRSTFNVRD